MARVEGFHFEDTLTGFKWIGSRASALNNTEGYRSIFCYEEAIGFCCGDIIFDKDGIAAMGVFAEMAYHVYGSSGSLVNRLQQIYDKYGEFVSNNGYYFFEDKAVIANIMDEIRNNGNYVTSVGKYQVASIRDLGEPGYDSTKADKKPTLPTSNSSPMITMSFTNGCVAQFRASGTEPKFKYYIEMKGQPGVSRDIVQQDLTEMSSVLLETLLKPTENGLTTSRSKL
jgi:phosphomannomutase